MRVQTFAAGWMLAAFLVPTLALAQAQAPARPRQVALQVADGERLVIAVDAAGAPTPESRGPSPSLNALKPPATDSRVETLAQKSMPANTAPADHLVATFRNFGAKGSVLRVENGFHHTVIYDAVLMVKQGDRVVVKPTSICPILSQATSDEGWGEPVEGVAIMNVREPPAGDLRCTGGAGLQVAPRDAKVNICTGEAASGRLIVRQSVDAATGEARAAQAVWTLSRGDPMRAPIVLLDYPMSNAVVAGRPTSLQVASAVGFSPSLKAKGASIVLMLDGVEMARQPWKMFADRAQAQSRIPAGSQPLGFFGVVPFPRADAGEAEGGYAKLLTLVGDGAAKSLEVRVVGDEGSLISSAIYDLSAAPVRDPRLVAEALGRARAAAAAPDHCAKKPEAR